MRDADRRRIAKTKLRERRVTRVKDIIQQNRLKLTTLVRPDGPVATREILSVQSVNQPVSLQPFKSLQTHQRL